MSSTVPARGSRRAHRAAVLAAAALAAMAGAAPAHAGLTATITPGLGLTYQTNGGGQITSSGYITPWVNVASSGSTTGGAPAGRAAGIGTAIYFTGQFTTGNRGVVMTPAGSYALNPLAISAYGSGNVSPYAVAGNGMVVGSSDAWSDDGFRGLGARPVWYAPGDATPHVLPLPEGFTDAGGNAFAYAPAVSRSGIVIGRAVPLVGDSLQGARVLRWATTDAPAQVLDAIPAPEGAMQYDTALSVNDAGVAVGTAYVTDANGNSLGISPVRWEGNGGTRAQVLGHLGEAADGTFSAYAMAVDARGMAVGSATKYDANHNALGNVAVRWPAKKAAAVELGGAGTDPDGRGTTYALGVDDAGMVVGVGQSFGPAHNETGWRALRWLPGHDTAQVLKPLSQWIDGSTYTYAYGVNRKGWIAGAANVKMNKSGAYSDFNNVQIHAVVWGPDGSVHDLNKLIPQDGKWTLYNAYGISDTGLVTGIGWYQEAPDLAPYQRLYALQLDKTGDGL